MATKEQIEALVQKGSDKKQGLHKNELHKLQQTARVAGPSGHDAREALKKRGKSW